VADASVIEALEAALQAAPEDDAIRRHLSDLLVGDGRAQEALGLYQDALQRHPDDAELIRAAALAARLSGQLDEAKAYERALGEENGSDAAVAVAPDTARSGAVGVASERRVVDGSVPSMTLADVGGLEEVKSRLNMAFLAPARNPELSAYYGKSINGGLLLYGPPGCGKTYTARALAGQLGTSFHPIGINDVLDMWMGESERKLHEAFETVRRSRPALLFLDELDALGRKRSAIYTAGRTVVNQLLSELDGVEADNEGIYVLAATNHPWDVDTALRRPGRFDRVVFVAPPDAPARAQILALHLRGRPTGRIDVSALAAQLDGFSGADLAYLCEAAVELAMQDAMRTGDRLPVSQQHLLAAAHDIRPSVRAWFEIAENVAKFANEGGEYDDLLSYMRAHGLG
jgi:SpoVK/Ycf46/Vps4 family AAA+-type ATPase